MKKVCLLVMVTALIFCVSIASAESEIGFNDISWLSDESDVLKALMEKGFVRQGITVSMSNEDCKYLVANERLGYQPRTNKDYEKLCFSMNLSEYAKGKVGGYPVKNMILTFAYDGSYKLISIRVELLDGKYEELKAKLTKVYGDCESFSIEDEETESNIWKGENNSAVMLYTESEGINYTLMYGRTDAVEILQKCMEYDPDDISGL